MRFGLFLQPMHHPSEHPTLAIERDLDFLTHLDTLGYSEAWIGEHHSTGWENIGSPEVFIAAAAACTTRLRLGTGVLQLGLHNPLVLLDRMILLDHLTRGRAMLGFGVGGGLPSDLRVFGLDAEVASRRLVESLEAMLALLESAEPVSMKTDWFELKEAVLQLAPYSKPHMHFATASTHPANVELIGRLGGTVLMGPLPDRVPEVLEHLRRGAASVGMTASRDQILLAYRMHVADSTGEAVESFREGALAEHYEFEVAVNGREPADDPDRWYSKFVERMLIGSVDDVNGKIERIVSESGGVGGLIFQPRDWPGVDATWESYESFARQIAPRYQGHVVQQSEAARAAGRLNAPS